MARDLKPLPRNIVQVEQAQITPYLVSQGKPDSDEGTVFSRNRGKDLSFKGNKINEEDYTSENVKNLVSSGKNRLFKSSKSKNNI